MKQGYKRPALIKIATKIPDLDRTLSQYKRREKSERIPLVLLWHYQIQGIFKVIQSSYSIVAKKSLERRTVFEESHIKA